LPRLATDQPLAGRGIVVTRPREHAAGLARLIETAGGRAIVFPAIAIEDRPAPAALARLAAFDLAVFISPTAVDKVFARAPAWPPALRAAAVGSGTRRELERRGVQGVLAPESAADSEALLALHELQRVNGTRVVIFRGEGGRSLLGDTLRSRGAEVEYAECYRRARPSADPAPLIDAWGRGALHAVTVSSAEGLENLFAMVGARGAAQLESTPLFVPHARVAAQAQRLGVREVLVGGPSDDATLERLVAYFHGAA
jgi:uroporphyrinogen-III synthase